MKLRSILKYETTTGQSFKELSDRIADEKYTMSDLVYMIWIGKLDENPDLKFEDAVNEDMEFEDLIKEFPKPDKKK